MPALDFSAAQWRKSSRTDVAEPMTRDDVKFGVFVSFQLLVSDYGWNCS